MITIGIIFLVIYSFLNICLIGTLSNINKMQELMLKRQDEIIKVLKNSKK